LRVAQTWIIAIDKAAAQPGQPQARFNPQSLTVAAGDIIYWRNNDGIPHWPAPSVANKTSWMDFQIPGKLPDQPAPTSQQAVSFSPPPNNQPPQIIYTYVCALHPDETGSITATS
jgi:plastocyanin